MAMQEQIETGDLILTRQDFRGFVRHMLSNVTMHALGRWEKPAIMWMTPGGRNILTIATYIHPDGGMMWFYVGRKAFSHVFRVKPEPKSHTGAGKWAW